MQEPSVPGRGGAGTNVPSFVPTRTVFPRCSCSPVREASGPDQVATWPGGTVAVRRTRLASSAGRSDGGSSAVAGSGGDRAAERQLQLGHPDEVVVDVDDGVTRALQDAGGDAGPEAGAAVDPDLAAGQLVEPTSSSWSGTWRAPDAAGVELVVPAHVQQHRPRVGLAQRLPADPAEAGGEQRPGGEDVGADALDADAGQVGHRGVEPASGRRRAARCRPATAPASRRTSRTGGRARR